MLTKHSLLTFRTQCATVVFNPITALASPSTVMFFSSRSSSSLTARNRFLVLDSQRRLELVIESGWVGYDGGVWSKLDTNDITKRRMMIGYIRSPNFNI